MTLHGKHSTGRCPTCGSDRPAIHRALIEGHWRIDPTQPCPDPFHSTGAGREQDEQREERVTLYRYKGTEEWKVAVSPDDDDWLPHPQYETRDFIPLTAHRREVEYWREKFKREHEGRHDEFQRATEAEVALRGLGEEIARELERRADIRRAEDFSPILGESESSASRRVALREAAQIARDLANRIDQEGEK